MKLSDRMKIYEKIQSDRLIPKLPVYARLDGRCFSKFTKKLDKPYSKELSLLMQQLTNYMVSEYGCDIGYTQSDEISLIWTSVYKNKNSEFIFNGKMHKLNSILAATATSWFTIHAMAIDPVWKYRVETKMPTFDCRTFNLPNISECVNILYWRELDAIRNSIQSLAQSKFSHNELHGKNTSNIIEMLKVHNIDWHSYPMEFKRGYYCKPQPTMIKTENGGVVRNKVRSLDIPFLSNIEDKANQLFGEGCPSLA